MPSAAPRPTRFLHPFLAVLVLLGLAACQDDVSGTVEGRQPDATVTMSMVQAAFIGSGSGGGGTLTFRGRTLPFTIAGGGIGGIGGSTIQAEGEVFNLDDVSRFPGAYAQARAGFALGTASAGQLWLQNSNGVVMRLHAARTGLMLSLGGDAMVITMNQ